VVEAAKAKVLPTAERAGIEVSAKADREVALNARVANLAGLVLANLLTNALEASPRGAMVTIEARGGVNQSVDFFVGDSGPGIPRAVQAQLFRPVRSEKRGGGGVGLAISLRLAKHAGGNLELVRSDVSGTEFRLSVPAR
jgi:signal transduction histidine kinase